MWYLIGINNVFGSIHQSAMTRIKSSFRKYWIVKTIVEHDIKIFCVSIDGSNSVEKWR